MAKKKKGKASEFKLPKKIAGVKIPKALRKAEGSLVDLVNTDVGRQVLAEALYHAAEALGRHRPGRESLADAGSAVTHAGSDMRSSVRHAARDVAGAVAEAASPFIPSTSAGRGEGNPEPQKERDRPVPERRPEVRSKGLAGDTDEQKDAGQRGRH